MGYWGMGYHALNARNSATLPISPKAPPSERDQQGLGKHAAQNTLAGRAQRQAQSHFARAVGGAGGKQAAQVGARG